MSMRFPEAVSGVVEAGHTHGTDEAPPSCMRCGQPAALYASDDIDWGRYSPTRFFTCRDCHGYVINDLIVDPDSFPTR